jgi:hypothetical protein
MNKFCFSAGLMTQVSEKKQLIRLLIQYFVSAGLSPNPSPEVGGALIQDKCVYFG